MAINKNFLNSMGIFPEDLVPFLPPSVKRDYDVLKEQGYKFYQQNPYDYTEEQFKQQGIPTTPIKNFSDYAKFKNLSLEDLLALKKESELEKYSRQRLRSEPEFMLGNDPRISEGLFTETKLEKLGKENIPRDIYTYIDKNLRSSLAQKGIEAPIGSTEYGQLVFPSGDKAVEAHEIMHLGFDKIPGYYDKLKNKYGAANFEHIYIVEKTMPELFDLDKKPPYNFSEADRKKYIQNLAPKNKAFDKNYRKKIIKETDKIIEESFDDN